MLFDLSTKTWWIIMSCFFIAIVGIGESYELEKKADGEDYSIHDPSIDGIRKYCNFLEDIQMYHENSFEFQQYNLSLTKVMILIRHGDRGPLKDIQRLKEISCEGTHADDSYREQDTETLFMTKRFFDEELPKINQNSNTSIHRYLEFPEVHCKIGQLSRFGVSQHIKLGHLLAMNYLPKLDVDDNELSSSMIVVKTTPFPRTFQSALAFLYGFMQTSGLHPSDLMTLFNDRHNIYLCDLKKFSHLCYDQCAQLQDLRSKVFQSFSFMQDEYYEKTVEAVQKIIATNPNDWDRSESVVTVFDAINLYVCHKEKLPCHKDSGCLTIDHVAQIFSYVSERGEEIRDSEESFQFCWMHIYAFLLDLIEMAKSDFEQEKIFLYSAHDLTIQTLAIALEFFDGPIPPYASRVVFEVYEDDNRQSKLMRIIYNGQDVTKDLRLCQQQGCHRYGNTFLVDILVLERFIHDQYTDIARNYNCSK